jgi:hypothetical protein
MMARPARVRMRSRKPCVLARWRLFGWKVRFTSGLHRRQVRAVNYRRPPRRADNVRCAGALVGTDPRYVAGPHRVKPDQRGRSRDPPPWGGATNFLVRHAENLETTCGHWLNPSRGLVTVPDSTASFRRRVCRGDHSISAGQRVTSGCVNSRTRTPHSVDDGVDVQRDRRSELTPGRHPKPGWHDNRETV